MKKGKKLSAEESLIFKDDKVKHPKTGKSVRYCAHCFMTGHTVGHCFIRNEKYALNSLDIDKPPRGKKRKASKSGRKRGKKS